MEYTQWVELRNFLKVLCDTVLILVVMEYTQWVIAAIPMLAAGCLNPCCNGIYSMSMTILNVTELTQGLNPCCNGIYSMSGIELLILVTITLS